MRILTLICIATLTILSACTKPTGYLEREIYWGNKYGYSEKKISDDEFAIIAEGNKYSSAEHVAKLALYHAAHVTIENKKEFFQIIQETNKDLASHEVISIPIGIPAVFIPVTETSTNEVTSILIIRITGKEQTSTFKNINALQVINELKPIFDEKN